MLHGQMILGGAAGGGLVSLVDFYTYVKLKFEWPWRAKGGPTPAMYAAGEITRILLGAGVAWGLAASDQLGMVGALIAGAGAPAVVEKLRSAASGIAIAVEGGAVIPNQVQRDIAPGDQAPTAAESRRSNSEGGVSV